MLRYIPPPRRPLNLPQNVINNLNAALANAAQMNNITVNHTIPTAPPIVPPPPIAPITNVGTPVVGQSNNVGNNAIASLQQQLQQVLLLQQQIQQTILHPVQQPPLQQPQTVIHTSPILIQSSPNTVSLTPSADLSSQSRRARGF